MDIPYRERGYSIEAETGVVHERYQEHARNARRTSAVGVSNVLNGREAIACEVCFPKPKATFRARPVVKQPEPEPPTDFGEQLIGDSALARRIIAEAEAEAESA